MNYIKEARSILAKKIDVEPDLLDLYTLLVFITGRYTDNMDVHDAWAVWKNKTMPNHKSLVPFDKLTEDVQALDQKYCDAIISTAQKLHENHVKS